MTTKGIHHYYRESNTAIDERGVLVRPALLLIEGSIRDVLDQVTNYTRSLIDEIVEASNNYAKSNEIKLFNDHNYSQNSRIGSVTGVFSAREITNVDIPENGNQSIIGKYAIFNDGLEIRSPDAIAQYHLGLLKELSIGIDLKGNLFGKNVIFEVSAVTFPAVEGASLYAKTADNKGGDINTIATNTSQYAFTFEAAKRQVDTPSNYETDMGHQDAMHAFSMAVGNIKNATDKELPKPKDKMIKNAINDLSTHLMAMHLPDASKDDEPTVPIITHKKMTEEITQYSKADITAMQTEIALLKKQTQDALKFSMLNAHATKLVQQGKLEPAKYAALFDGTSAFANYQNGLSGDPLESFLSYVESTAIVPAAFAPSIYGKTPLVEQDVPQRPEADQKAINDRVAEMARNLKPSYK